MWGNYSGSKPASEMGQPAQTPSATIRPRDREKGSDLLPDSMVEMLQKHMLGQLRSALTMNLGLPRLTPEELAERKAAREAARERVDGWLSGAIGNSTRAVIDLHKRNDLGDCDGCDPGSYAESGARWPCSTIYAIAPFVGINEDDLNLL